MVAVAAVVVLVGAVFGVLALSGFFSKDKGEDVAQSNSPTSMPASSPASTKKQETQAKAPTNPTPPRDSSEPGKIPKLLLGKWESVDPKQPGTVEFRRDRTAIVAMGDEPEIHGTFNALGEDVIEIHLDLGGSPITQKLKIRVGKDELVTTDEANKVDRFRRIDQAKAAAKTTPPGGYPTPDAAMNAFITAIEHQDVQAFKDALARDTLRLEGLEQVVEQSAKGKPKDFAWKALLRSMRDLEWTPAKYKRFPPELQGEDRASIVVVTDPPAGQEPETFRRYQFTRVGGLWYQTSWTTGQVKDLDPKKYALAKPAPPAPPVVRPEPSAAKPKDEKGAAGKLPPDWKTTTSQEGRFTVALPPGKSSTDRETIDAGPAKIELSGPRVDLTAGGGSFVVLYGDVPAGLKTLSPQDLLAAVNAHRAKPIVNAKVIRDDKVQLDGNPGRDWAVEAQGANPPYVVRQRTYLVKGRLYQVCILGNPEKIPREAVQAFFESFRLTPGRP
jgi:hypothetical protein